MHPRIAGELYPNLVRPELMIQAYLNSNPLKLFPEMVMGITIENFNISDMTNRKIDRTNVIQVPKAGNEAAFEFSSIPNAPTAFVYQDYNFDLIVDGIKIYENGRAFIMGENEKSYTLNITNNKNVVDLLKSISLVELFDSAEINLVTLDTWKNLFKEETNGFKIDYLFWSDYLPAPDEYKYSVEANYLSIYISTILDKIETDYNITFSGNLLIEADYLEMRIPLIASNLKLDYGDNNIYVDGIIIHDSLNAWDLIKNILQLFCGVFKINGIDLELQKFNELNIITPIDWSGKLVSKTKKFSIPGTGQKNYIKYAVASNVDKLDNAALIECNNLNLSYEVDLATMKTKLFPKEVRNSTQYTNESPRPLDIAVYPKLDREIDWTTFGTTEIEKKRRGLVDLVILVDSTDFLGQPLTIALKYFTETIGGLWQFATLNGSLTSDADTILTKYYDPSPHYSLIGAMLTNPVFYEAELLLNIIDIYGFDHFKAIQIDELEGIFYVNRIDNFLATSPGTPTKVKLIKIS